MTSDYKSVWGRRGQIADVALIVVILLVLAILAPIAATIMSSVNKEVQTQGLGADAQNISQKSTNRLGPVLDFGFLLVFALATIGIVIGAFVLDTHPAFFVFSLILFIALLVVGAILANVYGEFDDTPTLKAEADKLTIIPFIMQRFLLFVGVMGALMILALYAKAKLGDGAA